jgi:hypothetical protein
MVTSDKDCKGSSVADAAAEECHSSCHLLTLSEWVVSVVYRGYWRGKSNITKS